MSERILQHARPIGAAARELLSDRLPGAVAAVAVLAVFLLDTELRSGMAAPALYLVAVAIATKSPDLRLPLLVSLVCSAFTIIALFVSPVRAGVSGAVWFNRFVFLLLIWSATAILLQRERSERRLRDALRQKEILLRELHHRVKNNLQLISSIFSLQSRDSRLPEVEAALADSEHRVQAISLLHEMLYTTPDVSRVRAPAYLSELITQLLRSFGAESVVRCRMEIEDTSLEMDQAILCGLIINELVTNSLKHAFSQAQATGQQLVTVHFRRAARFGELLIGDNGTGLPEGVDLQAPGTLGLRIVGRLCRQLGGTLSQQATEQGLLLLVRFPLADGAAGDG